MLRMIDARCPEVLSLEVASAHALMLESRQMVCASPHCPLSAFDLTFTECGNTLYAATAIQCR